MRALLLRLVRLSLYLGLTALCMPFQLVFVLGGWRWATSFPVFYHLLCCRILGFRLETTGARSTARPTLFVANHSSYVDIIVFGALIPGSFVAKNEVRGWPLFGWLAKLQRSVFVDRRMRSTDTQRRALADRLDAGDNLILFPEGTSNDGTRVLPFKSALLSAAAYERDGTPLAVQPVSIAYTRLDGMPIGRYFRPFFAWYGDMDLAPHLWTLVGLGVVTIAVEFHPVVSLRQFGSRKALADHCREVIAAGVAQALSGRRVAPPAPPVGVLAAAAG